LSVCKRNVGKLAGLGLSTALHRRILLEKVGGRDKEAIKKNYMAQYEAELGERKNTISWFIDRIEDQVNIRTLYKPTRAAFCAFNQKKIMQSKGIATVAPEIKGVQTERLMQLSPYGKDKTLDVRSLAFYREKEENDLMEGSLPDEIRTYILEDRHINIQKEWPTWVELERLVEAYFNWAQRKRTPMWKAKEAELFNIMTEHRNCNVCGEAHFTDLCSAWKGKSRKGNLSTVREHSLCCLCLAPEDSGHECAQGKWRYVCEAHNCQSAICAEEWHGQDGGGHSDRGRDEGYWQDERGHSDRDWGQWSGVPRGVRCDICQEQGHYTDQCPKIVGLRMETNLKGLDRHGLCKCCLAPEESTGHECGPRKWRFICDRHNCHYKICAEERHNDGETEEEG
ncbi:hypothetical protein, partial [Litorimonas sp.]|uniref:hypothetical protein n=1 Tax=Litorimonas sp. TaxID=1892381 RepID=UPI003A8439AF